MDPRQWTGRCGGRRFAETCPQDRIVGLCASDIQSMEMTACVGCFFGFREGTSACNGCLLWWDGVREESAVCCVLTSPARSCQSTSASASFRIVSRHRFGQHRVQAPPESRGTLSTLHSLNLSVGLRTGVKRPGRLLACSPLRWFKHPPHLSYKPTSPLIETPQCLAGALGCEF